MKKANPDSNIIPILLVVFGVLILLATWINPVMLLRDGVRAKGVIEKVTCCSRKSVSIALRIDQGVPASPLRFGTTAGRSDNFQVGEVVTVVYDKDSPSGALVFRGEPTWTPAYIGFGMGGFIILCGLGLAGLFEWVRREEIRRKAAQP